MRRSLLPVITSLGLVLAASQTAWAHPGHGGQDFLGNVFAAGWMHPFSGLDHLLAMVAVGLLAVRIGGATLWIMPCTFMGSMLVGGLAATLGLPLPGVEYGIMSSVLVLGLLIAITRVVPLTAGAALVALFALFHGYAHAAEMASGGSLATYAAGFLLATAVLHTAGVLGGLVIARQMSGTALRLTGAAISAAGLLMFCGAL